MKSFQRIKRVLQNFSFKYGRFIGRNKITWPFSHIPQRRKCLRVLLHKSFLTLLDQACPLLRITLSLRLLTTHFRLLWRLWGSTYCLDDKIEVFSVPDRLKYARLSFLIAVMVSVSISNRWYIPVAFYSRLTCVSLLGCW